MNGKSRGFTLIELMTVVALAAIILTIAIPAFTEQLAKSRRADAISGLQSLALQMERWRADNPTYANTSPASANYPTLTATDNYAFRVSGQTATGYTLTASRQGAQSSDRCGNFIYTFAAGTVTKTNTTTVQRCWND
ncbi:MAG: prepilin-type N-terminal cleavage/methylation domain-containing protein [Rhodanobacteraceae bacterium]|nr:prepilin-type N-terminal cleavage/methylation domain-containing protein [Xanthomonadales bacterium]MCP5477687.1 prepilin-type N-terminal cleavage/methylation domain-containing protein [Rhodanobacteraceae bacterium]